MFGAEICPVLSTCAAKMVQPDERGYLSINPWAKSVAFCDESCLHSPSFAYRGLSTWDENISDISGLELISRMSGKCRK